MLRILVTVLLLCLVSPLFAADIETGDPALDAVFAQILDRDFAVKGQGIAALAASTHAKRAQLLRGIASGELRYLSSNNRLVWMKEQGAETFAIDALNGDNHGAFSARKFKKLALNNAMRNQIDALLAQIELADPDPAVRLASVNAMLEHIEPGHAELFTGLIDKEPDAAVREAMQAAIALSSLSDPDPGQRLKAIAEVAGKPRARGAQQPDPAGQQRSGRGRAWRSHRGAEKDRGTRRAVQLC